jgi:hypothetical protein
MANQPVPVSKEALLALLDDIRAHVDANDSFEGYLEYGMPFGEDEELIKDADFVVKAGYRIGNLQGQGGFRMIGTVE